VASEIAQRMGIGPVDPGWTRMGRTLLLLPNASVEQARRLGDELTTRFASSGQPLETEANSYMFRDYLFERICVQGPDHGRLEFNDAPASTTAAEIAQHTMDEYRQGGAPGGEAGSRARAVVDHIQANGTTRRLDPDSNLHDNGAQEGDTFRVSPESRAAAIDPTIRAEALSRVQAQILRFAQSTPRFDVDVTPPEPSTEYLLHFSATGFGAPLSPGGTPPLLDRHSVFVVLPAQFPMQAPAAFWQPPILFHPNVDPKYGKVCIGEFEDAYTPGLDFGLVCQLLIDIARYWNYRVDSALNADAARWACSPDGIIAIEARGGKNFLKGLGWSMDAKRPLKIKRIG
jgi:hypothetical protein